MLNENPHYAQGKRRLFEFLYWSGLVHLFRLRQRGAVLVAMYHDVLPEGFPEGNPLYGQTVSVEEFRWQIAYFKAHYNPITFQQFSDWYFRGLALPPRPVLITFDDGHANNLRYALPVLKENEMTAICFVLTAGMGSTDQTWYEDAYYRIMLSPARSWSLRNGECWPLENNSQRADACGRFFSHCRALTEAEQREELSVLQSQLPVPETASNESARFQFLSEDDVRVLAASGVEIGSHTLTHPILRTLNPETARNEIAGSKLALEQVLGKPVTVFAYPFGVRGDDFTPRDEALVQESGYALAFAAAGGFVTRSSNRFALPRVGIGRMTRAQFAATISGVTDFLKRILGRERV